MNSKSILIVLLFLVMAQASEAPRKKKEPTPFEKVLRYMFPSAQPKVTRQKRKHSEVPPKKSWSAPTQSNIFRSVDAQWMAKYWEQEFAWDYYIPEDDQIKFKDGNYIVPIVVFRHYEDMANSRRRATPTPAPR